MHLKSVTVPYDTAVREFLSTQSPEFIQNS